MSLLEKLEQAHQGGDKLSVDYQVNGSLREAYQYQRQLIEIESNRGNHLKGYKISLTSQETQELFGANAPLYGALTEDSVVSGEILIEKLSEPLIEIELMFLIDQEINPNDDENTILSKTRIAPGIEVPDSRYKDWFPNLSLTQIVADRAVAGKVVVGKPISGVTVEQLNSINAKVTFNGDTVATGCSSDVLGNPINSMKWLVQELSTEGNKLEKDMIVSSGTFIMPQKLMQGVYEASFENIGKLKLNVK
ncbi:2-keto-4-pentenoate hydratase [Piscibacillus sp. B03]|uniref:2-keto-4-pentenoate hydratase n=1 Tax=Piscibacillus sp. B03 TaxID=3457430 RepID=UPI003FCC9EDF